LVTGEEILTLTDFTLGGPLSVVWERRYKSSSREEIGLGVGWTHPFAESLRLTSDGDLEYQTAEARLIRLPDPAVGGRGVNRIEKLSVERVTESSYRIHDNERGPIRVFESYGAGLPLRLRELRDTSGNALKLSYQFGRLHRLEADHGTRWELDYDIQGRILRVREITTRGKDSVRVHYEYDAQGDLISASDGTGHREQYAYQNHLIACRTLKSGYRFHFEWDERTAKARCLRNWGDAIEGLPTYDYRFELK
jgi:YD repeat-containing protein